MGAFDSEATTDLDQNQSDATLLKDPRSKNASQSQALCKICKLPDHFVKDYPNVAVCNNCAPPGSSDSSFGWHTDVLKRMLQTGHPSMLSLLQYCQYILRRDPFGLDSASLSLLVERRLNINDGRNPAVWLLDESSVATEARLGFDFVEIDKSSSLHKQSMGFRISMMDATQLYGCWMRVLLPQKQDLDLILQR